MSSPARDMTMGYKQLTYDQRCQIYALKEIEASQTDIAKIRGFNQATISRELKRNQGERGYRYKKAQEKVSGDEGCRTRPMR